MEYNNNFAKHDLNHNVNEHFKSKAFINRKEEAVAIRAKYPSKIPIIVEKYHKEKQLPKLEKTKFLVPGDITMSLFLVIIRHRIKIKPTETLYLIIGNRSMLTMSLTMAQAYELYGDEDGFLYITYASQDVFGYQDELSGLTDELEAIRHRFPNKVPLYVTRCSGDKEIPVMGRNKFLVPQEITMSQFLYIVRNKIKLRNTVALYLLVNERVMVNQSLTMAQAYEQFRAEDGYLHLAYAGQQAFG